MTSTNTCRGTRQLDCRIGRLLNSRYWAPAVILFAVLGCRTDRPPDGHIVVKNDSQDRSYNIITVSGGGAFASLKPGEKMILPATTRAFTVERRYKEYTRSYSVSCPPLGKRGIFVKLIDIHVNRIAGGCKTVRASKE